MLQRLLALLGLLIALGLHVLPGQTQEDRYIRADRLGIAHISSVYSQTPEIRYQQALALGAGWNRWPLYWDRVQTAPGTWYWDDYDRLVTDDLNHGLKITAILLGRPDFYADGVRIAGMHTPIFADGTDTPGVGKSFNPENPWVTFAYAAVNRYKPNGILAQRGGLPRGQGIRVWEVWNEPDVPTFWQATPQDYARLLKISYIVIKMADPAAQVMSAGLLYNTGTNWLASILNVFINDPDKEKYNWYVDIVAIHSYGDPWRTGWITLYARQTLVDFGIMRPIWVTESGVPVWDDYPGPTWNPRSYNRATLDQQAWYFIQSTAYAWSEGADKVFLHQLYDDCGDQPAGSNFPPHGGEICDRQEVCFGDAHGVYRNLASSSCFSHHPYPGTPRPIAQAYRLIAEAFGAESFETVPQRTVDSRFVTLQFYRPRSNQRITVMWNSTLQEAVLEWPAVGERAQLVSLDGSSLVAPMEGFYRVMLPPALADVDLSGNSSGSVAIGGPPFILIESSEMALVEQDFSGILPTMGPVLSPGPASPDPTLDSTPMPAPRPTTDPALDTTPPVASVLPLPEVSEPTFTVAWEGSDNSGIASFLVWVRIDGGEWQIWLTTSATSAVYSGEPGRTYEFAVWAVDLADNWSDNIALQPQASTRVE